MSYILQIRKLVTLVMPVMTCKSNLVTPKLAAPDETLEKFRILVCQLLPATFNNVIYKRDMNLG